MSEWRQVALGDVVHHDVESVAVVDGASYPIVGVLNRGRGLLQRGPISAAETKYARLNVVRDGQLVYSKLKAFEGAVTVATGLHDSVAYASPEFPTFTCGAALLPHYMRLVTALPWFWDDLARLSTGIGGRRERVAPRDLLSIQVPLPPVDVQRRIADLVGALDANIAALEAEADSLSIALGTVRAKLSSNPSKVRLITLAGESGIQIGPFGSQLHAEEYTETGVGVVMPQDLTDGSISTSKLKRVPTETAARLNKHRLVAGDIVFPRRGDLSKRALVTAAEDGWLCGTGCIRFRPAANIDGAQVFEALSNASVTEWLVERAVGTTMLNLNTTILEGVPLPAPTAEMSNTAQACTAISTARAAVAAERRALIEMRAALLPALLSGHLGVPESYDELVGVL